AANSGPCAVLPSSTSRSKSEDSIEDAVRHSRPVTPHSQRCLFAVVALLAAFAGTKCASPPPPVAPPPAPVVPPPEPAPARRPARRLLRRSLRGLDRDRERARPARALARQSPRRRSGSEHRRGLAQGCEPSGVHQRQAGRRRLRASRQAAVRPRRVVTGVPG